MEEKRAKKKHVTRREKKQKRVTAIGVGITIVFCFVLAWQAIAGLVTGDWLGAENYQGQPIDPAIQLVGLGVALVVGGAGIWHFLSKRGKSSPREKTKRRRAYSDAKYPHEEMPWH